MLFVIGQIPSAYLTKSHTEQEMYSGSGHMVKQTAGERAPEKENRGLI